MECNGSRCQRFTEGGSVMKAITVRPEWAKAIAEGRKTIETRSAPPNGNMRPGGVRGLPGHRIDQGERIAIHAAGPDSAIVATAEVSDVAIISGSEPYPFLPPQISTVTIRGALTLHQFFAGHGPMPDWYSTDLTNERALGDFTPDPLGNGRWAWVLHDVKPLDEPIRCNGRQGVWQLPADVAELMEGSP